MSITSRALAGLEVIIGLTLFPTIGMLIVAVFDAYLHWEDPGRWIVRGVLVALAVFVLRDLVPIIGTYRCANKEFNIANKSTVVSVRTSILFHVLPGGRQLKGYKGFDPRYAERSPQKATTSSDV